MRQYLYIIPLYFGLSSFCISVNSYAHSLMPTIDIGTLDEASLVEHNMPQMLKNTRFVYQPHHRPFTMNNDFSDAKSWLALEEPLLHWSGAFGVDPRVVLTTLMVNKKWSPKQKVSNSDIKEYSEDIKHIANRLSQLYYHANRQSKRAYNAATYSIAYSLPNLGDWPQWQEVYQHWFSNQQSRETVLNKAAPEFQWPWRISYNWVPNGPHSHTGSGYPLSSVDVSYDWPSWGGQTYSVTAAHDGYVTVFSRCQIRVSHPDGWATNYYHMDGISVKNGAWVDKNTRLGTYASQRSTALCQGGSSTGPHLHFSVLYNGQFQSIQDLSFGPYSMHVGRYSYDSHCNFAWMQDKRSNTKACFWDRVNNPSQ
ncbi:M23 family metallopeptidase [Vibrio ostreicida]|uniref:M23 family metallopeptidase n=1 Tax=Vibrio ostreicida TaxID=526588 RepID=A0ABT8BS59_9VIBR|nr:M23 family metallopeptidase [Vibrio ostreicida]MDN3609971.1 M23 family metallopeptidase [Vibrio ostreicida]NPD10396.1 M23 family metallopeptidase [Vibrio ostreicida]